MDQITDNEALDAKSSRPVVVGIGASAGGLDAILQLLSQAPLNAGISYVVIQHLSPDHHSALAEILGKRMVLPIQQVEGSTEVLPDHVYVIPPGKYLSISDGRLELSDPTDARGTRMAIDYFFRSLAEDACENAVGVILSGTGSDGTAGIKEIKQFGGLTIVQDPNEASHRGMPQSAVNSGSVDLTLAAKDIASRLLSYVEHARQHGPLSAQAIASMDQVDIQPVIDALRRSVKHDFRNYRRATLSRRISRRMGLHGMEQVKDYAALLGDSPDEVRLLKNDLLIGVTRFMRDADSWELLRKKVIKPLVERADSELPIRIWCPGCATGEEAYTMAMLFAEQAALVDKHVPFQIFASDVSTEALEFARAGDYSGAIAADLPVEKLRAFFQKTESGFRVSKQLRERVVFAEQNVLAQPPFSKLDLISCRNLLIYLQSEAQSRVFSVFQFALKAGGHLFLGSAESIERSSDQFETINAKHRIFRRTESAAGPSGRALEPFVELAPEPKTQAATGLTIPTRIGHHVYRQLVKEFEQGVAVINERHEVLYLEGRVDLYLQLRLGETSGNPLDLFAIAREGIRARLRTMIRKAFLSQDLIEETCRVKRDDKTLMCVIKMRKVSAKIDGETLLLITFELPAERGSFASSSCEWLEGDSEALHLPNDTDELRHELLTTREQLSTTIAQLEAANEELKASNEEAMTMNEQLQSGNEELETSKEELQSLNEELTTLNNQLELKLDELQDTTDDLNNLLTSASVPTIFLDTSMRIRRFTPSCRTLYKLIPTDVGRPLEDIVQQHDDDELVNDARKVLKDLGPQDKELESTSGKCFLRRISPYRTEDDRIQGVVVTFADITEVVETKRDLHKNLAVLDNIFQSTPVGLAFNSPDLSFVRINDRLAEINGFPAEEHIGRKLTDILPAELASNVVEVYQRVIDTAKPVLHIEIAGRTAASLSERIWDASYMPVMDLNGEVIGVNTVVEDVTVQRRYERELSEKRDRLEIALAAGRMGTWYYDMVTDQAEWSVQMQELFGIDSDEFVARKDSFIKRVHPNDRSAMEAVLSGALTDERDVHRFECRVERDIDKSIVWVEGRGFIRRNDAGEAISVTGVVIDVTERRGYEESLQQAKETAEAANRSRGEFLANMSHEIRTPMTAILGYVDMLGDHLEDPDNLQFVKTIRRNGRFLLEIINDILDLSKIDAGQVELTRGLVSPASILADVVSLMSVRADERKVALDVKFEGPLPALMQTDSTRLRQILVNLVGNAIKFTSEGRVTILPRYETSSNVLVIGVRDTGIGISESKQDTLFEPFTQADSSITRDYGGTGLGLAISQRLAHVLGGKICVKSALGEGSTFTVSIDAGETTELVELDESIFATDAPQESDVEEAITGVFLVVDDRRDIRFLAQHFIESLGGTVHTAENGLEAVTAVKETIASGEPLHAICMDMQMPVMDGYAATRELRRLGIEVPVIALTANAMDGDRDICTEAGCTEFVRKPIERGELLTALRRVIGKKHSELIGR